MKQLSPEQIARLRPEARERYEARLKIVKRNRKILGIVSISLAAVLFVLALSMTVFFNISSINVENGSTKYTDEQIIMASGLNIGDNMVRTNFKKVEERIEKSLPYVLDAAITKKVTGKVTLNITYTKGFMAVKTSQGYVITDAQGKTLEVLKSIPKGSEIMLLKLKGTVNATPGEIFTFSDANEEAIYNQIVANLNESGMMAHITEMDLTQRSSLKLIYQNRLRLILGSSESLSEKIKSCAKAIDAENKQDPGLIAEINLTIPKKVYVNPLESLDPPKKEEPIPELPAEDETTSDTQEEGTQVNEENASTDEEAGSEGENNSQEE